MNYAIIGAMAILIGALSACAQDACGQNAKETAPGDNMDKKLVRELNITKEQQEKLKANRVAQMEKMKTLRTAMQEQRTRLMNALKDPAVTRAGVEPIVTDIKTLEGQKIELRTDGIFAVKEILTPEQFTRFQEKMEKARKQKSAGKGRTRGHGEHRDDM
ncbi:MAG: periplasmic heavy metal sensor [Candidatus Omnitrophica bacterium]|nr:periplasmic heavy metal sensor [Candidatus Omnitrophota bacterium]